uniref:Uncharacterized protein n=1 Tax=Rhizophora mucronata TaxID=61149 RepID=A0A2P2K4N7_RHIMU
MCYSCPLCNALFIDWQLSVNFSAIMWRHGNLGMLKQQQKKDSARVPGLLSVAIILDDQLQRNQLINRNSVFYAVFFHPCFF